MVQHVRECEFVEAVEFINETPPPRGESRLKERDPSIEKERREERRDAEIERNREEDAQLLDHIQKATRLFESGVPIEGTLAQDYFEDWRGLDIFAFSTRDLRFRNDLDYWGKPGLADKDPDGNSYPKDAYIKLGAFPAVLCAMRDLQGRITGIKRIYLDRGGKKLKPPGSPSNGAKKGTYTMSGGLVYLDEPGELLAIGEGVETTAAWKMMAREASFGEQFAHATIACADSLMNLTSEELSLPSCARSVILIGDSDSNPKTTLPLLQKAAHRFKALGLESFVHPAPNGKDWNDVLMARIKREAA
jgi:hypothetical protein